MKLGMVKECYCGGEEEDLHFVLWCCPLYDEIRDEMLKGVVRPEWNPVYYSDLVSSPENFQHLRRFAHRWHKKRVVIEIKEKRGQSDVCVC